MAFAFYMGGSANAGEYFNNKITTNVPAVWAGTPYGNTSNAKIYNNTIIKTDKALPDFKTFKFGF